MKFILASAFVQLVGLVVLHDQPKAGVRAILPKAEHHVESHTAIVAFKTTDLVNKTGWTSSNLTAVAGGKYSYVVLHGEHISFEVNGRNERAAVPKKLPSLTKNCRAMTSLDPGYLPPYKLASAVVLIPVGTLDTCRARTQNSEGRIDTTIALSNSGAFKLTSPGKSLTFRDNTTVLIGNVPTNWLERRAGDPSSAPHSDAYFAMALSSTPRPGSKCSLERVTGVPDCESAQARQIANVVGPRMVPLQLFDLSYECSNTQWP